MNTDFYKGKRVLVTGGNGFIGGALATKLKEIGAEVMILDTDLPPGSRRKELPFVGVCDKSLVHYVFASFQPEVVFHLAAQTEVAKSHFLPYETYVTNFFGTLKVLEQCRLQPPQNLVVASTDKAYGPVDAAHLPYTESQRLALAGDCYAGSKRCMDDLCHDYARLFGLNLTLLRSANTYGPGQRNQTTLITSAILSILKGQKPKVHKQSKNHLREWLYIDDAVRAYLWAGQHDNTVHWSSNVPYTAGDYSYNVGSGQVFPVSLVVELICEQLHWNKGVELVALETPQIGDQYLNSNKFISHYGTWFPFTLRDGLTMTIEWYKNNF